MLRTGRNKRSPGKRDESASVFPGLCLLYFYLYEKAGGLLELFVEAGDGCALVAACLIYKVPACAAINSAVFRAVHILSISWLYNNREL